MKSIMKTKEVTLTIEYSTFDDLQNILDRVYAELTQGKEYFEDVIHTDNGKRLIHFMQKYKQMRTFKFVNSDSIIVKSKI